MEKKVKVVRLSDRWKNMIISEAQRECAEKGYDNAEDFVDKKVKEWDNVSFKMLENLFCNLHKPADTAEGVRTHLIKEKFEKVMNGHVIMKDEDVQLVTSVSDKVLKNWAEFKAERPTFSLFQGEHTNMYYTVMEQFLYAEPVKG